MTKREARSVLPIVRQTLAGTWTVRTAAVWRAPQRAQIATRSDPTRRPPSPAASPGVPSCKA